MSEMLERMMQDAHNWQNFKAQLEAFQAESCYIFTENEQHLKGYIYDSLVFRYIKARDAEAELEQLKEHISYKTAMCRANRDKMRFMEILNEVIGEHD